MDTPSPTRFVGSQIRDSLTGAYSRALFQERWPDELERARRYNIPLALCILDADYFKSVNDAFGHHRGDLLLKDLTHRIRLTIRGSDILFRYGGDEFLLLLPNTDSSQAAELCSRILHAVGDIPFAGEPPVSLGVSIGISAFPRDGADCETLFHVADLRCYEAKRRGRHRFVFADAMANTSAPSEPTRLLEREEALVALQSFLDSLPAQGKGSFVIRGQPGSGKTRFLQEAAGQARLRRFCIWPISSEKESADAEGLQAEFIRALECSPPDYTRIDTILRDREAAGLFCCIDRMEGAGQARLEWMERLLSPENPVRTCAVWTCPPGSYSYLAVPVPLSVTIELAPLTVEGLRAFIQSLIPWEPPIGFLNWMYRQTGGFPKQIRQGMDRLIRQNILQTESTSGWKLSSAFESIDLREWLAKTSTAPPNNLPLPSTEFFGREKERSSLLNLISENRLVTITGPGGIGKTRMALQAAHDLLGEFPDGAFFIPLGEISEPQLLLPTVSHSLGVLERGEASAQEAILHYLRNKRILLILDTMEHLSVAAGQIAHLITHAPHLHILATSSQPLHLSGEQLFSLPPLTLPENSDSLSLSELVGHSAIALFVKRAKSVRLDFQLTPDNRAAVIELVSRLDGLPLAIELAAARIVQYSPQEMLTQDSLTLLSRAPNDFPLRHQTLRAVVRWSADLLTDRERKIFALLGLFAGSFDVGAVELLCRLAGIETADLFDVLMTLVERNLVTQKGESDGTIRYRLMLPIREGALDLLKELPDASGLKEGFADYFFRLVENQPGGQTALPQKEWLNRIGREYENIRATLNFLLEKDIAKASRMASALGLFWEVKSFWSEARSYLNRLDESGLEENSGWLALQVLRGKFARLQGDFQQAETILQYAISVGNTLELRDPLALLLHELGWVVYTQGEHRIGKGYFEQALEICRETGNPHNLAIILGSLGWIAQNNSEYPEAVKMFQESIDLYQSLDHPTEMASVLSRYGRVEFNLGNYQRAEDLVTQSFELFNEVGDLAGSGHAMQRLGEIVRASGDFTRAEMLLKDAVRVLRKANDLEGLAAAILSQAEFARSLNCYDDALSLYAQHMELAETLGMKGAVSASLKDQGEIARHRGNFEKAAEYFRKAKLILDERGYHGDLGWILRAQAELALAQKDSASARRLFSETIQQHFDRSGILLSLLNISGMMGVLLLEGFPEKAAILHGSIDSAMAEQKSIISIDDMAEYESRTIQIRDSLTTDEWQAALAHGRSLTLSQALLLSLSPSSDAPSEMEIP